MESKIKFKPNPEYRSMDQVSEVLRYYQGLIKLKYYYLQAGSLIRYRRALSMFLGIKGTWYE